MSFVSQLEPGDSASSSNLSLAKPRPSSELNGQSPSHLKVQRSVSSNHKQRRYSEQGVLFSSLCETQCRGPSFPFQCHVKRNRLETLLYVTSNNKSTFLSVACFQLIKEAKSKPVTWQRHFSLSFVCTALCCPL